MNTEQIQVEFQKEMFNEVDKLFPENNEKKRNALLLVVISGVKLNYILKQWQKKKN